MNTNPSVTHNSHSPLLNELNALYPELSTEYTPEWLAILDRAQLIESPIGTTLATVGSLCTNFMLLLDGSVRIYQDSNDGREVTLYRITPGDVCLMSLNSLLHNKPFRANAKTETNVRMLMFRSEDFHTAMAVSKAFRTIMLTSLVDTMCTMVHTFYDTAFEPLDMRLAYLLGRFFRTRQHKRTQGYASGIVTRTWYITRSGESIIKKPGKPKIHSSKAWPHNSWRQQKHAGEYTLIFYHFYYHRLINACI